MPPLACLAFFNLSNEPCYKYSLALVADQDTQERAAPPLRSLALLFRDAPRPRLYAARAAFYLGNFLIDDTAAHGPGLSMRPIRGHTGTGNGSVLRAPRADPERGSVVGSAGATLLPDSTRAGARDGLSTRGLYA